jgi:hypothetical protein
MLKTLLVEGENAVNIQTETHSPPSLHTAQQTDPLINKNKDMNNFFLDSSKNNLQTS